MNIVSFKNTNNIVLDANNKPVLVDDKPVAIKDSYTTNVKFIVATDKPQSELPTSLTIATMLSFKAQHASQKLQILEHYLDKQKQPTDIPVTEYSVDTDSIRAVDFEATDDSDAVIGFSFIMKPAQKPYVRPVYNLTFGEQAKVSAS